MRSNRAGLIAQLALGATLALSASPGLSQNGASPARPGGTTRHDVEMLASVKFDGRLAGSPGERLAGDYLVSRLQELGARPLPGRSDDRLAFEFTAGTRDGGSTLAIDVSNDGTAGVGGTFNAQSDIRALSFSDNGEADGPVIFAGYGLVVPEGQRLEYDSYAGLDVKDKVVLVLRYFPEDADQQAKGILARYADLRYKAMAARQRGAKALLVVTGPSSPNAGETVPMTFDTALSGSGIVAASVAGKIADRMFAGFGDPGKTLAAAQKALDRADPHVIGFDMPPHLTVSIHTNVIRDKRLGYNIAAYLPATSPVAGVEKPWIALGAHYDHLGHGENGNSLAAQDEAGKIHFGADDNASGCAAVLAVAEALSKTPRRRNVQFDFWSGEELGLIGSTAFVNAPPVPLDQFAAYVNFDMVGRMHDNRLTVQATGTSPTWGRLLEQANVAAGFDLQLQDDPYQPTDVASFGQVGVPSLNFFTGTHPDYHRPSDTADRIDYEDLDRIAGFAAAIVKRISELDHAPLFTKVEPRIDAGAGRAGVRVFTGTVPDYSTAVKGLLLSGVVGGGPAEQAGLQKGDVIVEIAGQTISNIYDYTYALDVLKINEPTKVVYIREGQRRETTLTPAARK